MFCRSCPNLPQALILQILASLPSDAQACSAKLVCKASCKALDTAYWYLLVGRAAPRVVQQMIGQHQDYKEDLLIARAELGDVHAVAWLLQNGCPASQEASEAAAAQGYVAVLGALQAHGCLLDEGTCCAAARAGQSSLQVHSSQVAIHA
jgi:hypothetical protein